MKVAVSQYGSRRRYMIPQILEENGILDMLYTDSTSKSCLGKIAKFINSNIRSSESLKRLSNRITGIPDNKVYSNDFLQIKLLFNRLIKKPFINDVQLVFEGSSAAFIKHGIGDVDWLYTMFIENIDFVRYAKAKGVKIIADIYENPFIWRELVEEIDKPQYRSIRNLKALYEAQADVRQKYIDELLKIADQYLVPSEYVQNSLMQSLEYDASKVNIIPYVSSVKNTEYHNNPDIGRIIWIGNDVVRKGLCYCAEAATVLKKKYDYIDFRIIGPMPSDLTKDSYFKDLNFIGYCNKSELAEEFIKADMFVFPTLAEGFAGVLLEASSFGVPIITTDASGFAHDAPCVFIPKRESYAIVDEVTRMIEDREYRYATSLNLFNYSQNIKSNQFAEELISLLKSK